MLDISVLKNKVLLKITVDKVEDSILFSTSDDEHYKMYHIQDCCEQVSIDDIIGDLDVLIGHEILIAEERTNADEKEWDVLWTFYELATINGSVTIRWHGQSEYYSVAVDIVKVD